MRRFVGDLLHAAKTIPSIPVQRRLQIGPVVAARALCAERPPWVIIFLKAYARVAAATPELRRAYIKFPIPHLYEYSISIASVAIERDHLEEKVVFIGKIKNPAAVPLAELTRILNRMRETPMEETKEYRRIRAVCRLPWPIRRGLWWLAMNLGRQRGSLLGTFGISVYSSQGAESLHPLAPATTVLNYDRINSDGTVNVRIVYDHRVMDGACLGRVLAKLEAELTGAILAELQTMTGHPPLSGPTLFRSAI